MRHKAAVGKSANIFYEYRPALWLMPAGKSQLADMLLAMAQAVRQSAPELWLVCDRQSAQLNRRFLGCVGPTNIITFPGSDGGSLFLAVETLLREAALYQQGREEYLLRLLAHGFGHLAGLDHGPAHAQIEARAFAAAARRLGR